jgi:EmrB/QacA subfamily drug resistance transporter
MTRRWKILILVSIGDFMAYLDAPVVSVAFPSIQKSYGHTSPATLAWVLDAYFIGFAAFLVIAGKLADRLGRRKLFIAGLWLLAGASLACAVAPSVGVLIAARTLQAVGAAFVIPGGLGLMLAEFDTTERKTAIGIIAAIVGLGVAASPTVGGVVVDLLSWRWIFYIGMGVVLCAAIFAYFLLEREAPVNNGAELPDRVGGVVQTVSLTLIVLAILKRSEWGTTDVRTLAALIVGLVAFGLFVHRSFTHRSPLIDVDLFRNGTFAVANLSVLVFSIGFFAATITSVFFMEGVWHYSVLQAGLTFAPGAAMAAVVSGLAGKLAERYGSWTISAPGCAIAGVGLILIATRTDQTPAFATEWVPGQLVYSVGVGLALTGLVGAALTSVPADQFALGSGVNAAIRQVGGALGVAVAIATVTNIFGGKVLAHCQTSLIISAIAMFVAGAIALGLRMVQMPLALSDVGLSEVE